MESITPQELAQSKDKSFMILDIRDKDSYERGHVDGSINIDVYSDIHEGNKDQVRKKLGNLPKDRKIVVVCNAGVTAQPAASILESMGRSAVVLEKGMIGWNYFTKNIIKAHSNH